MTEAVKNKNLQPYTTEMSEAAHKLIAGVELDDELYPDNLDELLADVQAAEDEAD